MKRQLLIWRIILAVCLVSLGLETGLIVFGSLTLENGCTMIGLLISTAIFALKVKEIDRKLKMNNTL
ncbi:MAG: hypothetical protein GZ094_09705 [Mariniphaga sp.]|nr:hypothetical protein [Mariniphaga sp.]